MIARRFRALGWVAAISSAATGLYLISLQVASERAKLEAVDRRIAAAQREMRQLQTELGTRASMRQLQKWNDEDLALAVPRAAQYLHSEVQLASLDRFDPGAGSAPSAVRPALLLAAAPAPVAAPETRPRPVLAAATVRKREPQSAVATRTAAVVSVRATNIRNAAYVAPVAQPRPQRVALVDRMTLGDLARTAARERSGR